MIAVAPAVVHAVLATLRRATADARTTVVLRGACPRQAAELSRWLARAHGAGRRVVCSTSGPAEIEVRLPARMAWPDPEAEQSAPRGPPR